MTEQSRTREECLAVITSEDSWRAEKLEAINELMGLPTARIIDLKLAVRVLIAGEYQWRNTLQDGWRSK